MYCIKKNSKFRIVVSEISSVAVNPVPYIVYIQGVRINMGIKWRLVNRRCSLVMGIYQICTFKIDGDIIKSVQILTCHLSTIGGEDCDGKPPI